MWVSVFCSAKEAPPSTKALFKRWHGKRFDWRWENLEHLLAQLLEVLPDFKKYYNAERMAANTKEGQFFLELDVFMRQRTLTKGMQGVNFDMLLVIFEIVWQVAWLELCPCHEQQVQACTSYQERLRVMRECGCPSGRCPWQGRRGIMTAAVGVSDMGSLG